MSIQDSLIAVGAAPATFAPSPSWWAKDGKPCVAVGRKRV